jgi:hypothetical protein
MPKIPQLPPVPEIPKVGDVVELLPHHDTVGEAQGVIAQVTRVDIDEYAKNPHITYRLTVMYDPGGRWRHREMTHTCPVYDVDRRLRKIPRPPKFLSTTDADQWLESVASRSHE